MDNSKNGKDNNITITHLITLMSVIFGIWLISIGVVYWVFTGLENRAQFGDSFGMINSLFSGLAFAGIIYTILLQRKELALQRNELELTRKELERSASAQVESQKELARQSANLKQTAVLNALSTLVNEIQNQENYYRSLKSEGVKREHLEPLEKEKEHYLGMIRNILHDKSIS